MEIITSNISKIAVKTKMVLFGNEKCKIKIDISKVFQGDEAYIEVTEVSKAYGKRFRDWTKLKDTIEYIAVLEEILKSEDYRPLSKPHKIGTHKDNTKAKIVSPLIVRKAGRYGGTYLHRKLALKYFRWLDVDYEIAIDMFLEKVYKQVTIIKVSRVGTKALFHPLTDSIRDIYIPAQTDPQKIKYAYQMIMDMINLRVIGMKAWEFRKMHDLPPKTNILTRDYFSQTTLDKITHFQQHAHTFILAGFTDFEELEKLIDKMPI